MHHSPNVKHRQLATGTAFGVFNNASSSAVIDSTAIDTLTDENTFDFKVSVPRAIPPDFYKSMIGKNDVKTDFKTDFKSDFKSDVKTDRIQITPQVGQVAGDDQKPVPRIDTVTATTIGVEQINELAKEKGGPKGGQRNDKLDKSDTNSQPASDLRSPTIVRAVLKEMSRNASGALPPANPVTTAAAKTIVDDDKPSKPPRKGLSIDSTTSSPLPPTSSPLPPASEPTSLHQTDNLVEEIYLSPVSNQKKLLDKNQSSILTASPKPLFNKEFDYDAAVTTLRDSVR